ncbi:hypothetical protein [Nocardiopsis synnemataformans]|uniref:hypothetical protein n=1 Tax=Nocardiopsis synnemataformans TaxID=61305 RepID=UPI003EBC9BF8
MKPAPWRTGRKLGRTLYERKYTDHTSDDDRFVGIMDSRADAQRVVDAVNAVARIREIHKPDLSSRSGWNPDDDDTPGAYGQIERACQECGSQDMAVRWPCPTIRALGGDNA